MLEIRARTTTAQPRPHRKAGCAGCTTYHNTMHKKRKTACKRPHVPHNERKDCTRVSRRATSGHVARGAVTRCGTGQIQNKKALGCSQRVATHERQCTPARRSRAPRLHNVWSPQNPPSSQALLCERRTTAPRSNFSLQDVRQDLRRRGAWYTQRQITPRNRGICEGAEFGTDPDHAEKRNIERAADMTDIT